MPRLFNPVVGRVIGKLWLKGRDMGGKAVMTVKGNMLLLGTNTTTTAAQ